MQGLFGRTSKIVSEWSPASIPGCIASFRSDLGAFQDAAKAVPCIADSLIYTGADQSENGNDLVQAVEIRRFQYKENILDGHPAWRAAGSSDADWKYMWGTGGLATLLNGNDKPFSAFIVFKQSAAGLATLLCWSKAIIGNPWYLLRLWNSYHHVTQNKTVSGGTVDLNPHYSIWTSSGLLANTWVDGSQVITNGDIDEESRDIGAFAVGGLTWVDTQFFVGDYFEIAIYDNEISAANRALLNAYAHARYPSI